MAHNRDQWWVLVSILNFGLPQKIKDFLSSAASISCSRILTPYNAVLLENLIVTHLAKSPIFLRKPASHHHVQKNMWTYLIHTTLPNSIYDPHHHYHPTHTHDLFPSVSPTNRRTVCISHQFNAWQVSSITHSLIFIAVILRTKYKLSNSPYRSILLFQSLRCN
jgi:hypothetical protein